MASIMSNANGQSQMERVTARRKLKGRAFYESLGSPKMILAPMVDQSEFVCFLHTVFPSYLTDFALQAWRMLTRSFMPPETSRDLLAYTPMMHSRLFSETAKYRDHSFQPTRSGLAFPPSQDSTTAVSDLYLDGNPTLDRPLFVQFCANSPDELLEAAKYVQPFCDAVDLNLGCPQGIARKGHYGAFLQEEWSLVYQLINKLHTNLDIPVTAKMRILETREKTVEYAKVILSAGASIITVHGRQRDQKGHNTGLADWSMLRYLRENLPPDTVIFANGNILQHGDIKRCLRETGADGVMSAEGNLCDPTIFAEAPAVGFEGREYWRGRDRRGGYRMDAVFRKYMNILYQYVLENPLPKRKPLFLPSDSLDEVAREQNDAFDQRNEEGERAAKRQKHELIVRDSADYPDQNKSKEQHGTREEKKGNKEAKTTEPNLLAMQAHLFHVLRPLVSQHTNIRDALARCRAGNIQAFEKVLSMVEAAVREGLLDYESDPTRYENRLEPTLAAEGQTGVYEGEDESSFATVQACKRPWWVCQPYVRPLPKEALEKGAITLGKKEKRGGLSKRPV